MRERQRMEQQKEREGEPMEALHYLKEFCEEYEFPREETERILAVYETVLQSEDRRRRWQEASGLLLGEEAVAPQQYLVIIKEVAAAADVSEHIAYLAFHIEATRTVRERYEAQGIDRQIQKDTLEDLLNKARECKMMTGAYGLYTPAFLYKYYRLERFAFGRMQFELGEFVMDSCTIGGREIRKGDQVIRCHIPRSPKPFDDEARIRAYKGAYEFYKDAFPGMKEIPFTCDSWLMFPLHEKILPETSNMVRFTREFKCLRTGYDTSGSQLWRIFGMKYTGNPDDFVATNSLQRGYKKWLQEGNFGGSTYGIFLFDGSKIINQ